MAAWLGVAEDLQSMSTTSLVSSHGSASCVRFKAEQVASPTLQSPRTIAPPRTVPSPQASSSGSMEPHAAKRTCNKHPTWTSKPSLHDASSSRPETPNSSASARSATFVEGRLLLNDLHEDDRTRQSKDPRSEHVRFVHLDKDRAELDLYSLPLELFGQQLGDPPPTRETLPDVSPKNVAIRDPPNVAKRRTPKHPPRKPQLKKSTDLIELAGFSLRVDGQPISNAVVPVWTETPGREGVDESVLQMGSVLTDESAENEKAQNESTWALEHQNEHQNVLHTTMNTDEDLADLLPDWAMTSPSFLDSECLPSLPTRSGSAPTEAGKATSTHLHGIQQEKERRPPAEPQRSERKFYKSTRVQKDWSSVPPEIRGLLRRVPSPPQRWKKVDHPIVAESAPESTIEKASVEVQCSDMQTEDYPDPDDDSAWSTGRRFSDSCATFYWILSIDGKCQTEMLP